MDPDGMPMPSPISKPCELLLAFEPPEAFEELAQKAAPPRRTPEYERIVPSWNIRTEQDEYLEKMQAKLQNLQVKRADLKTSIAEVEEAAYQPDEEEDFAPRGKPDEKPPPPPPSDVEEAPLITDSAPQTPTKPKIWRVRFQEDAQKPAKKRKEGDDEEEPVRTERTPLMPPPRLLREEGDEEESGCKCCCLLS